MTETTLEFQTVNPVTAITQGNAADFHLLYTPGIKNLVPLDGYVTDFRIFCKLPSVSEFTLPDPDSLAGEQETDNLNYSHAASSPGKIFELWTSQGIESTKTLRTQKVLWNRAPGFETDILDSITKNQNRQVPHGVYWWGKIRGHNSPDSLGANDAVTVDIVSYEEGGISVLTAANLNQVFSPLTLTNSGAEYSFSLPNGTQGFSFKCRGDSEQGDAIAPIRWAWQSGAIALGSYDVLNENAEEAEPYLPPLFNKTLYFSSSTPGVVVLIKMWVP